MAIRQMTSREAYEADPTDIEVVRDYPGAEDGKVYHDHYCLRSAFHHPAFLQDGCGFGCHVGGPLYMHTTFRGRVLKTGEHNWYDDSDFYAIVWHPSAQGDYPAEVEYGSTRGWSYPNHATVDATPEVQAAYAAWLAVRQAESAARRKLEREARVERDKLVRVVRGRKVAKGTLGVVFWTGASAYGDRVGLTDAAGATHWTAEDNVEVVGQGAYEEEAPAC
jgi:hypothetical protein